MSTDLNMYRLHGISASIFISAAFAAIWGVSGSFALPGVWRIVAVVLVAAITAWLLYRATSFRRAATQADAGTGAPPPNPFRTKWYRIAVVAEIIAIPVAGRLLTATGNGDAIMPVVAMIVGLHFFGLIPAFRSWQFAWVGGSFCALALIALTLPVQASLGGATIALRQMFVGMGCALILWLANLGPVLTTQRQLVRTPIAR